MFTALTRNEMDLLNGIAGFETDLRTGPDDLHTQTAAAPKSRNAVHTLPSKPATPDLQPKTLDMRTRRIERHIRRHLGIGIRRNRHLRHRHYRREG